MNLSPGQYETPNIADSPHAYENYWRRKQLLAGSVPDFPVKRWWTTEHLCEVEQILFDTVLRAPELLDFGAGDLRIMKKLKIAGFSGEYHTLDISPEYEYTYRDIEQVDRRYGAILCLDVLEHMPLEAGLGLLRRLVDRLADQGTLIVQTPNARCINNPMAWDMTHVQCYSITDLWAYLSAMDLHVEGYRVCMVPPAPTISEGIRHHLKRWAVTRVLGCDYADNIVVIARRGR